MHHKGLLSREHLHWYFIHVAMVFFVADTVALVWPAFHAMWESISHGAVALATLLATASEYLTPRT